MPIYQFETIKPDGTRKKMTLEAASPDRIKTIVKSQGAIAINIKEAGSFQKEIDFSRVKIKDLAIFCEQMESILKAGVPATEALEMVAKTTTCTKLKKTTLIVVDKLKQGNTLSACMSEFPDIYPVIMVQMIKAGEASGSLDTIFGRMATQFEKSNKTKSTIKKALAYPKMILVVVFLALIVVCSYVIPMFVDIFNQIGTDLPITTKFFIFLSDLCTKYWYWGLLSIIVLGTSWFAFSHSEWGQRKLCAMKLKIPLFRNLEEKTASANLARTLSRLLKAGLDYPKALAIASDTMENVFFQESVQQMIVDIKNGLSLSNAVKRTGRFPELLESMVEIGDNTGNVEEMLENSANYFEDEVETATVALTSALQPIIIIIMGVFVGMLVYSIYSPMFSMYSGIG